MNHTTKETNVSDGLTLEELKEAVRKVYPTAWEWQVNEVDEEITYSIVGEGWAGVTKILSNKPHDSRVRLFPSLLDAWQAAYDLLPKAVAR